MNAQAILNADWYDENSQRKYPLNEDATALDDSGTFSIPNDLIVDLLWPVQADLSIDPTLFHIAGIAVFGTGIALSLGYDGSVIGMVSIDANSFSRNQTFLIQGTGAFYDTVGKIVIGSLDTVKKLAGAFTFVKNNGVAARLVPTVIRPDIRGVSALYLKNGDELSGPFQDDIVLMGGQNMLITRQAGVGGEPDRIVFNAISGLNLNEDCQCGENAALPCIRRINGVGPDENGDFTLLEDACLKLQPITNGLQLTDECSQPCCGCNELKVVRDALELMITRAQAAENVMSQLESAIALLQTNTVGR